MDENQAVLNNCGKQTLKNISTPGKFGVLVLILGQRYDTRECKPLISIKPFVGMSAVGGFCQDVTHDLENTSIKRLIDSFVQKNPSDNDYQLLGTVSVSGPNFTIDVILKAPGGKDYGPKFWCSFTAD